MQEEFKHLNKDDLYLLMESYRNMIQMHSTLIEQHKTIIDVQHEILNKQDDVSLRQVSSNDKLNVINSKLDEFSEILNKTRDAISTSSVELDKSITSGIGSVNDKVGNARFDLTKQHSSIVNRLYVSMGLMATIILGLTSILIGLINKYNLLSEVHQWVNKIAEYLDLIN